MPLNAHTAKLVAAKKISEQATAAGTTTRDGRYRLARMPAAAGSSIAA